MSTKTMRTEKTGIALVDELNRLVNAKFPKMLGADGRILCGKLYYMGADRFMGPQWMLSGMTPVGPGSVIRILDLPPAKTARARQLLQLAHAREAKAAARHCRLVDSARAKLTRAECRAVGI